MLAQDPCSWNKIAFAPIAEFLELALSPVESPKHFSPQPVRHPMVSEDQASLTSHIASDSKIGRLAVLMIPIVDEELRQMPNPAAGASHSQNKIVIAGVEE